jgi:hypothetical protein
MWQCWDHHALNKKAYFSSEQDSNLKPTKVTIADRRKDYVFNSLMTNVIARRLNVSYTNPDLTDCYYALFRPGVMLAAIDIIAKRDPDLAALGLAENNLLSLDSLSVLSIKLPNLKVLNIGRNNILHASVGLFRGPLFRTPKTRWKTSVYEIQI